MTGLSPVTAIAAMQQASPPGHHLPPSAAEVAKAAAIIEAASRHAAALSAALAAATQAQRLADHAAQQLVADQKAQMSEHLLQRDEAAVEEAGQTLRDAEIAVAGKTRTGAHDLDISV